MYYNLLFFRATCFECVFLTVISRTLSCQSDLGLLSSHLFRRSPSPPVRSSLLLCSSIDQTSSSSRLLAMPPKGKHQHSPAPIDTAGSGVPPVATASPTSATASPRDGQTGGAVPPGGTQAGFANLRTDEQSSSVGILHNEIELCWNCHLTQTSLGGLFFLITQYLRLFLLPEWCCSLRARAGAHPELDRDCLPREPPHAERGQGGGEERGRGGHQGRRGEAESSV